MTGQVKTDSNEAGEVYIIVSEDNNPIPGQAQAIMQPKEARDLISQIETAIMKVEK